MTNIICPKCKTENPRTAEVCKQCGAKLLRGPGAGKRLKTAGRGLLLILISPVPGLLLIGGILLFKLDILWLMILAGIIGVSIFVGLLTAGFRQIFGAAIPTSKADKYLDRAAKAAAEGSTEDALVDVNAAIEKNPKRVDVWFARGILYQELGRYKEARSDLKKTLSLLKPLVTGASSTKAHVQFKMKVESALDAVIALIKQEVMSKIAEKFQGKLSANKLEQLKIIAAQLQGSLTLLERDRIIEELSKFDTNVTPILQEIILDESLDVDNRMAAATSLTKTDKRAAIPLLVSLLKYPYFAVRLRALQLIDELNDPTALSGILEVIENEKDPMLQSKMQTLVKRWKK
jgi:ribosomal protein L40E